ncbi:MAG: hypothetical protein SV201_05215 [Pseudomonadota bacterium]|nr:hypothetical protein [Pseudomonadota bacterium]
MIAILSRQINRLLLVVAALSMAACAANTTTAEKDDLLLEVHDHGRIHIFYDKETFAGFMQNGETSYRLTRIGAGPNGETIVFGLTGEDKKKRSGISAVEIFDGKRQSGEFYGEMYRHGRIYVFDNYPDMKAVRDTGHAAYFYTEIGSGPKGETVVYVLNSDNKKKKPIELIEAFREFHNS